MTFKMFILLWLQIIKHVSLLRPLQYRAETLRTGVKIKELFGRVYLRLQWRWQVRMEHCRNEDWQSKTKAWDKPIPVAICLRPVSHTVPWDRTTAFVVAKHRVIPQLWHDLQGYGIFEVWKIKFVLSNCQTNYCFNRTHIFIKLMLLFYKVSGREWGFIFILGRTGPHRRGHMLESSKRLIS
jgi:hypothetical protein